MDLASLYQQPGNQDVLHPRYYVEGAIFGASASPEIPMPDVWLPWAIAQRGQMKNTQQADAITEALFVYFKQCLASMTNKQVALPAYCEYALSVDSPLALWLQGLMAAHSEMEQLWQNAWAKMQRSDAKKAPALAKRLKHCIGMFSTFADTALAIEQANIRGEHALAQKLPVIFKSLPVAVIDYVAISGELAAYLPNQFETFEKPE